MTAGLTGIGPGAGTETGRRDLSARLWAAVALAGFAALNLQLFGIAHPPLIDWANHLARHGIHCAAPGWDGQAAHYDFAFRLVPNLAGDLLHALEAPCRDLLLTRAILVQWATRSMLCDCCYVLCAYRISLGLIGTSGTLVARAEQTRIAKSLTSRARCYSSRKL